MNVYGFYKPCKFWILVIGLILLVTLRKFLHPFDFIMSPIKLHQSV